MEAVTGQQEAEALWEGLKPKIEALITRRINLFHDAMVERGQIKALPPSSDPIEEATNHV